MKRRRKCNYYIVIVFASFSANDEWKKLQMRKRNYIHILGSKLTKDNQGIGINSYNQGEQAGTGGKGT